MVSFGFGSPCPYRRDRTRVKKEMTLIIVSADARLEVQGNKDTPEGRRAYFPRVGRLAETVRCFQSPPRARSKGMLEPDPAAMCPSHSRSAR